MPTEKERNFREREREKDSDKGRKFKMEDRRMEERTGEKIRAKKGGGRKSVSRG